MRRLALFSLLLCAALCGFALAARAQMDAPATEPAAEAPAPRVVPAARANARATMETFLKAMAARAEHPDRIADAAACLDLSEINEILREQQGQKLAETLLEVIDRTRFVEYDQIPDDPEGAPYVFLTREEGEVRIARVESGEWLFTKETVSDLPALFKVLKDQAVVAEVAETPRAVSTALSLRQRIPNRLQQPGFILELWQWVALFLLALVGMIVDRIVAILIGFMSQRWSALQGRHFEGLLTAKRWRPVGLLAATIIWSIALPWLDLPERVLLVLFVAVEFAAAAAGVWTAYNLVDVFAAYLAERAALTETKLDDLLIPLVRRSLKIFVVAFGLIFIADNLNINITSLLAGIGLGGLAFALAAKDTVENLFGSLTVILDHPFHIGDWVVIGGIEGTVESVGFRSTRIRTFYNSLITLPNSQLINASIDNYGARRYRRIKTFLSLTYDTPPEKVEAFCEGIRELLRQHPYTRKDYFQVYLNQFAAHSLDVLLYCFHETPDWNTELRERHRLFLDILRLAQKLQVQFAFPTQTLHFHDDGPWRTAPHTLTDERAALEAGRDLGRDLARAQWDGRTKPPPVEFKLPGQGDEPIEQRTAGN